MASREGDGACDIQDFLSGLHKQFVLTTEQRRDKLNIFPLRSNK